MRPRAASNARAQAPAPARVPPALDNRLRELSARPSVSRTVWHGHDAHRQVEVAHHAANDRALLVILEAENGRVRLHDVEKLQHDRADAAEMPRPRSAAQRSGDAIPHLPKSKNPPDTFHSGVGRKMRSAPCAHKACDRRANGRGYREKSSFGPNCAGFTKMLTTTRPSRSRLLPRSVDKRCVTVVQRAHRRHQNHRPGSDPDNPANGGDLAQNFHRSDPAYPSAQKRQARSRKRASCNPRVHARGAKFAISAIRRPIPGIL